MIFCERCGMVKKASSLRSQRCGVSSSLVETFERAANIHDSDEFGDFEWVKAPQVEEYIQKEHAVNYLTHITGENPSNAPMENTASMDDTGKKNDEMLKPRILREVGIFEGFGVMERADFVEDTGKMKNYKHQNYCNVAKDLKFKKHASSLWRTDSMYLQDTETFESFGRNECRSTLVNTTPFQSSEAIEHATVKEPVNSDDVLEQWHLVIESALQSYTRIYYENGICNVLKRSCPSGNYLLAIIEQQQCHPKKFWNGIWQSQWRLHIPLLSSASTFPETSNPLELEGVLKVQVNYCEGGNIQLQSFKKVKENLISSSPAGLAKEIVSLVNSTETNFHMETIGDLKMLSDKTFKTLRRQLPVTHTKIDWNKVVSCTITNKHVKQ